MRYPFVSKIYINLTQFQCVIILLWFYSDRVVDLYCFIFIMYYLNDINQLGIFNILGKHNLIYKNK